MGKTSEIQGHYHTHKTLVHSHGLSKRLGITEYIQKANVGIYGFPNDDTQITTNAGAFSNVIGAGALFFHIEPPSWLMRYAIDNGLIITATTATVNWSNTVSADFITRIRIYHMNWDTNAFTTIFDDPTDLGDGSTGFRNDVTNFIDTALEEGDWIIYRYNTDQTVVSSCRFFSILVTYTLT